MSTVIRGLLTGYVHKMPICHCRTLTSPHRPMILCHLTETWLNYHWAVHRAAGAGAVYPLYSHPIPRFRPQAAAELLPCGTGSGHPWIGKLPGPSLLALPPSPDFVFLISAGELDLRRLVSQRVVLGPGRQTVREACLAGTGHCTPSLCSVCDTHTELICIDFLGPIRWRAGPLASPVHAGEKSQATERARVF